MGFRAEAWQPMIGHRLTEADLDLLDKVVDATQRGEWFRSPDWQDNVALMRLHEAGWLTRRLMGGVSRYQAKPCAEARVEEP
jgi:hypothetical protein